MDSVREPYAGMTSVGRVSWVTTQFPAGMAQRNAKGTGPYGREKTGTEFGREPGFSGRGGAGCFRASSLPLHFSRTALCCVPAIAIEGRQRFGVLGTAFGWCRVNCDRGVSLPAQYDVVPMMFVAEGSGAEGRGSMSVHKQLASHGDGAKGYGIDDILKKSHRYSEEIRQRDREDQKRAWLWFCLLMVMVGTIVAFWSWISQ